jgi:hypothetical protein
MDLETGEIADPVWEKTISTIKSNLESGYKHVTIWASLDAFDKYCAEEKFATVYLLSKGNVYSKARIVEEGYPRHIDPCMEGFFMDVFAGSKQVKLCYGHHTLVPGRLQEAVTLYGARCMAVDKCCVHLVDVGDSYIGIKGCSVSVDVVAHWTNAPVDFPVCVDDQVDNFMLAVYKEVASFRMPISMGLQLSGAAINIILAKVRPSVIDLTVALRGGLDGDGWDDVHAALESEVCRVFANLMRCSLQQTVTFRQALNKARELSSIADRIAYLCKIPCIGTPWIPTTPSNLSDNHGAVKFVGLDQMGPRELCVLTDTVLTPANLKSWAQNSLDTQDMIPRTEGVGYKPVKGGQQWKEIKGRTATAGEMLELWRLLREVVEKPKKGKEAPKVETRKRPALATLEQPKRGDEASGSNATEEAAKDIVIEKGNEQAE